MFETKQSAAGIVNVWFVCTRGTSAFSQALDREDNPITFRLNSNPNLGLTYPSPSDNWIRGWKG